MPKIIKNSIEYAGNIIVTENDGVTVIKTDSFSSLPLTITNPAIKSSHVVIKEVLSNPSAQTSDWSVTSYDGSLTITGSISGSTDIQMYLMELDGAGKAGVVAVEKSSVSSLPTTITDSKIQAAHACVKAELSNPSAQTGDWTVTAVDGSLTISGSISGTTDVKLYLATEVS